MTDQLKQARHTTHQERIVAVEMRELKVDELENIAGGKSEGAPADQDSQSGQNQKNVRSIVWGC